jgi:hypothetical protein
VSIIPAVTEMIFAMGDARKLWASAASTRFRQVSRFRASVRCSILMWSGC